MVSVALESSKFAFDAVLMVSNDSRKVRSIVPVLPKNVPLRVMTSLNRVRDALIEHQIDAQVLEEGLSSKGLSVLNELYDLVLQGMGERWVAKGGRLLIVMAEPIDGVLVVDSAMLGAGRLASIAEEQAILFKLKLNQLLFKNVSNTCISYKQRPRFPLTPKYL